MIKADIVRRIGERLNLKDKEALAIVDATLEAMKKIVADSGRLEIRDFGVFQTKQRKERLGRNPKDKREYPIPSRRVVTFKMGKELKLSGVRPGDGRSESPAQPEQAEAPQPEAQPGNPAL
jgi:integration host factor subunit beta